MDFSGMRRSYERGELDEATAGSDPLALFESWFAQAQAAAVPEPYAMTLATVGDDGRPSARVVLAREISPRGVVWFTSRDSRKGRDIAAHPVAALQFYWPELERTVRLEGDVTVLGDAESDVYFAKRPVKSQISAWASPQSEVIASRDELEQRTAAVEARFGDSVPRPPNWGGYLLVPDVWEFWQGRRSRLHDRIRFRRSGNDWIRERLGP